MVAYSFQARFIPSIEADVKLQTIRAPRKRHARFGEELQLYSGMRTKHCRLIGRRRALSSHNVVVDVVAQQILVGETYPACRIGCGFDYKLNGLFYRMAEVLDIDAFAIRDGFADWSDMRAFWLDQHGKFGAEGEPVAFHGVVIRWVPGEATASAPPSDIDATLAEMGVL